MQDCRREERNDRIEMKEIGKAEHCESTGQGNEGEKRGGEGGVVIMKTSA